MSLPEEHENRVYPMSTTSPCWKSAVQLLQSAPTGTFDRKFGDTLAGSDDDQALTVLVEIITEDPYSAREYKIAGQMLHHLLEVAQ